MKDRKIGKERKVCLKRLLFLRSENNMEVAKESKMLDALGEIGVSWVDKLWLFR